MHRGPETDFREVFELICAQILVTNQVAFSQISVGETGVLPALGVVLSIADEVDV